MSYLGFMILQEYLEKLANNTEVYLKVKVWPRAGKNEFLEIMADGVLKIALKAEPEQGAANILLIKLLAKELKVAPSQIKIISGASQRRKLIKISQT